MDESSHFACSTFIIEGAFYENLNDIYLDGF